MEVESIKHYAAGVLPHGVVDMTPYYDGSSDYVYLFSGLSDQAIPANTDVFRFSISSHVTEIIGKTPEVDFWYPAIVVPSENPYFHLYFLQTRLGYDTNVYKYDITNGTCLQQGTTSIRIGGAITLADVNGKYYGLGGVDLGKNIVELAIENGMIQTKYVGNLTQRFVGLNADRVGNIAFIFGRTLDDPQPYPYVTLDMEALETSPPKHNDIKDFDAKPTVVATKRDEVFIFGGVFARNLTGIVQMNTTTQKSRFIHIEGFPECVAVNDTYFMTPPNGVFVESQNRIYFFGGVNNMVSYLRDIWYINLNDIPDFI